jgi:hypothetical protein
VGDALGPALRQRTSGARRGAGPVLLSLAGLRAHVDDAWLVDDLRIASVSLRRRTAPLTASALGTTMSRTFVSSATPRKRDRRRPRPDRRARVGPTRDSDGASRPCRIASRSTPDVTPSSGGGRDPRERTLPRRPGAARAPRPPTSRRARRASAGSGRQPVALDLGASARSPSRWTGRARIVKRSLPMRASGLAGRRGANAALRYTRDPMADVLTDQQHRAYDGIGTTHELRPGLGRSLSCWYRGGSRSRARAVRACGHTA